MTYEEKIKLKNEARLSIYNQIIGDIMENVEDYESLPAKVKLQLSFAMKKSRNLVSIID
jgi:hypothetical protein